VREGMNGFLTAEDAEFFAEEHRENFTFGRAKSGKKFYEL
jgi:hypothetical protein